MAGPAVLSIKILGDSKDAQKAFRNTEKDAQAFGGRMGKLGGIVKAGFVGMAVAAPAAALAVGKALYDIGAEMDEMADTIRVGTGASGEALDALINDAEKVAARVPAGFDQVGKTVADVSTRLGLSGETLQTVSAQYLEAGRILGEEVDINSTAGAFNAWEVAGDKTSASLDTLFRTSQSTGIGMNSLSDTLSKHAPTLKLLNFSYEESAGLIGLLDKSGLDANSTLGGLTKSLSTLAQSGEEPNETFTRLTGSIKEMKDAGNIGGALELSGKLFGTKNAAAFLDAVDKGIFSIDTLREVAAGSGDTILGVGEETQDAAEKMQILGNRIKLALAPYAETVFSGAADALDWLLDKFDSFDMSQFTAMFNHPVLQTFISKLVTIGVKIKGLWDAMRPVLIKIKDAFIPVWQTLSDTFFAVIEPIKQALWSFMDAGAAVIDFWTAVFAGDWSKAWESIGAIFEHTWNLISNLLSAGWEFVKGLFSAGSQTISIIWSAAWNAISNFFGGIWETIKTGAYTGINNLISTVQGIPEKILGAFYNAGSWLYDIGKNIIQGLINGVMSMGSALWDSMTGIVSSGYEKVKSFLGINSPSRLFMRLGVATGEGMAIGIDKSRTRVDSAARNLLDIPYKQFTDYDFTDSKAGAGKQDNQPVINITVNGAVDARSTARQIKEILLELERSNGVVVV